MRRFLTMSLCVSVIVGGMVPASADQASDALAAAVAVAQQQQQQQQLMDQLQQQQQQQQQAAMQQQQQLIQQQQQQYQQQFTNPYSIWNPNYQQTTTYFNPGGIFSGAYSRAGVCRLGDAACPVPASASAAYREEVDPTEAAPPAPLHHRHHRRHRTP